MDYTQITLRDEIAMRILPQIYQSTKEFSDEDWRLDIAIDAYAMADAMINARGAEWKNGKDFSKFPGSPSDKE